MNKRFQSETQNTYRNLDRKLRKKEASEIYGREVPKVEKCGCGLLRTEHTVLDEITGMECTVLLRCADGQIGRYS